MSGAKFSSYERAYLMGGVVRMLKEHDLIDRDREILEHLRDRLAIALPLASDVARILGLGDQGFGT